jgi:hypothetical protein
MIALGIVATWLALTTAGYAALSAFGRIELDEDLGAERASREAGELTLSEMWPAMSGASPR